MLHTSWFIPPDMGLEGILLFIVRIYPQNFHPLPIVEVSLPIRKGSFQEFVDLEVKSEALGYRVQSLNEYLRLVHPIS